jgi:hypothetical protein
MIRLCSYSRARRPSRRRATNATSSTESGRMLGTINSAAWKPEVWDRGSKQQ